MNHRIPKRYTILISRTGREPIFLSFQPVVALLGLTLSIALPLAFAGAVIYSYVHKNTQLAQKNSQLTKEAIGILQRVEDLEGKIETLQERAGMPKNAPTSEHDSRDERSLNSQGGVGEVANAETLLATAKAQLPNLLQDLTGEVEPALEQTLVREEARPKGLPLKINTEISSFFGLRPNPFGWGYEFHQGIDFIAGYGTPVYATATGVIETAGWDDGFGYHVVINHGYGCSTLYGHLSEIAVKPGMRVKRYEVIGYSGDSGRSSGPHLHYGVYRDGRAVDPKKYF